MNKSQLVDALAERLGDRRTASSAVDGLIETIVTTVKSGESVALSGFGVFESRARAPRTGRNPRTGEVVQVAATTVPAFRPGSAFKSAVAPPRAPMQIEAEAVADAPAKAAKGKGGAKPKAAKNGKNGGKNDDKGKKKAAKKK